MTSHNFPDATAKEFADLAFLAGEMGRVNLRDLIHGLQRALYNGFLTSREAENALQQLHDFLAQEKK